MVFVDLMAVRTVVLWVICWGIGSTLVAAQPFEMESADGVAVRIQDASRLVALGGSITETLFALGAGDRLVGVDQSSVYPPAAHALPQLGYFRQLSAEGVLSRNPSLILAVEGSGPPAAIAQLRAAGVPVLLVPSIPSIEGAQTKIRTIARAVGLVEEGERLITGLRADLEQAAASSGDAASGVRILFIYARGGGTLNVSGTGTAADAMIRLAGAQNAVEGYEDYRPLTAEAAVAAAPDVLLVLTRGLESIGGVDGLLKVPGLALTPAGRARRVVAIDDALFLGFGPRLGEAVIHLKRLLYDHAP